VVTVEDTPYGNPPPVRGRSLAGLAKLEGEGVPHERLQQLGLSGAGRADEIPTSQGGREWWAASVRAVLLAA